jgi:hypothetical protein
VKKLSFSAHARLKDIVGRGLIISDNIAVIELIKNSKDAGSPSVGIEFTQNENEPHSTELRLIDFGCGMSMDDIEYKWLNIAYSEKKNSSPLQGAYAGNKGIGRFSCDRLGSILTIYTKKQGFPFVKLHINWEEFEVDDRDKDIGKIVTIAQELEDFEFENETKMEKFQNGTLLLVRGLRQHWDLDKLKSLRRELERFIIDPNETFEVKLSHWSYPTSHSINSPIENKIFEELDFRATSITAETSPDGKHLYIELRHDGDFVFRSVERNPYDQISSVKINILFLNQPAKAFFKKRTGYRSVEFGSIFLFLNGFRVFPYGSFGDDWLGIQRRHAQGQRRFFGTRDLVGFIQIIDSSEKFIPVSSREGIVRNKAFQQLVSLEKSVDSCIDNEKVYGLFHKVARKLEKFVVDGLDWDRIDRSIGDDNDEELLSGNYQFLKGEKPILETIDSIVKIRTPEAHITEVDINVKYLSELAQQGHKEYEELVVALENKFGGTPIDKLNSSEKKDLSKFISRQAKELLIKDETNRELERKADLVSKELQVEKRRRLFADFEKTADQTRIIQLHHQVGLIAGSLLKRMDRVVRKYRSDPSSINKDDLFEIIESSIFQIEKIQNVAKLASKADFDLSTNRVREDLIQFTREYIENFKDVSLGWGITVNFRNEYDVVLMKSFRPIEITLLIDNIIDNAGKAGSKRVDVTICRDESKVIMQFDDNGQGLTNRFQPNQLFEKGVTTTSGSGIGLSHSKQIVTDLSGKISISNIDTGARVRIEFSE